MRHTHQLREQSWTEGVGGGGGGGELKKKEKKEKKEDEEKTDSLTEIYGLSEWSKKSVLDLSSFRRRSVNLDRGDHRRSLVTKLLDFNTRICTRFNRRGDEGLIDED